MFPLYDTIPRRHAPVMTLALIGVNVAVFLFELTLPSETLEGLFHLFGVVPARYTHPEWAVMAGLPLDDYWPFATSQFLHGGWSHLLSNMWMLWIFGDNVEDRMGSFLFLVFYLACGIAAGLLHWVANPDSTLPVVGASGAIAGVMGAYMIMFPSARVITLVPLFVIPLFIPIPAVFFLFIWFISQFFSGAFALLSPEKAGGIAWWAHVGGFGAGIILHRLFAGRKSR